MQSTDKSRSDGQYKYDKLPSAQSIRLLRLLPVQDSGYFVSCEVVVNNLNHPDCIEYTALSYTWGAPLRNRSKAKVDTEASSSCWIGCNGYQLEVRENLYCALIRLRDAGFEDYFWIDAISINQEDLDERSAQVSLMGEIYASAENVVVWLGEEDADTKIALPLIAHLFDNVTNGNDLVAKCSSYLNFNDPKFYEEIKHEPLTTIQWKSVGEVLTRTWFRRLWVVQELVLAKEAYVLCGGYVLPWDCLLSLSYCLWNMGWWSKVRQILPGGASMTSLGVETIFRIQRLIPCQSDGPKRPAVARLLRTWVDIDTEDQRLCAFLVFVLDHTRAMSVTDLRDKVYAVLPMVTRYLGTSSPMLPRPDYRKSVAEVYREFTRHILQHSQGLMYLSWVEDKRRRRRNDLPSWVPDLSIEMAPLPLIGNKEYHATASWRYQPIRIKPGDTILPLVGLEFDTIQEVSELIPTAIEESMFLPLLEMAFSLPHRSSGGYDRLEVLMRTLVADRVDRSSTNQNPNNFPIAKVTNSFIAWLFYQICMALVKGKDHRRSWMDDASFMAIRGTSLLGPESPCFNTYLATFSRFFDSNKSVQSEDFTKHCIEPSRLYSSMYDKTIWIRRLARTRQTNLLCLTAPSTAPGDQIWYLQGGRLLFVFRALPNGNWDLRGEAYVHGCMSGEDFTKYGLIVQNACEIRVE